MAITSWFRRIIIGMLIVFAGARVQGQQAKVDVLRIGTSGTPMGEVGRKEEAALDTLKDFIKDETGFTNDILRQKDWAELADKMAKGQLHLGVFMGYEFAWATEKLPDLKPLALAINVHRYPVAHVMVKKDNAAKDFAGLKGQSLALPNSAQAFLRLYIERSCQANGSKLEGFFAKIATPEFVDEALDDVVDGAVQVTVVDKAALDAFQRRKPGRFAQLKEVAHSQPFPPPVIAYYDKVLDAETLNRFQKGILNAATKEKGKMMLTLFRLTGFETAADDFGKVIAETRKAFPAPDMIKK